jgi:Beta-lactamase enzyme family/Polyglycine hydrolase-like, structural repeat
VRSARFALPLAAVALALALPGPVAAAGDATGWSLLADADVRTIDERIAAGYRLTEIDTVSTSPERFAATFQRDSGTGPAWWWYHDLRFEDIQAKLAEHGARLTRLEGYRVGGEVRYAALMVDNTGAAARAWWWWVGTPEAILTKVTELNARVIDLERHPDGLATAVMVARGRTKSWTYIDRSPDEINDLLAANNASVLDIEPAPNGLFDVVMVEKWRRSWWYVGKTSEELIDLAAQNGARLTDVDKQGADGDERYAAIMVPNVSRETSRVNDLLRGAVEGQGHWGLYLKQVNGPELSSINERRSFEPASTIKTLYHLKAIHSYQADLAALDTTPVTWYEGQSGSCPTGESPATNALSEVLRRMMQNSDNRAAQAVLDQFGGFGAMNQFAQELGTTGTSVNHMIGCADGALASPNQLTLYDAGLMLERAANGTLLTRAGFRKFRKLMAHWRMGRVDGIVMGRRAGDGQEAVRGLAPSMRVTRSRAARFLSRVRIAWKGGSYGLCTPACLYDFSLAGWASVPFKQRNGRTYWRAYVFGMFAEDATSVEDATRAWDRGAEVLRPVLRQALRSWKRAGR